MNQLTLCLKQKDELVSETNPVCKECQNKMVNFNYCTECKNPVFARCANCGQKEMVDLHEFCYCQLELYNL